MTPAQRSALHRIARRCVQCKDWGPLDAYVTAYAERARSSLDRVTLAPGERFEPFNPDGTMHMPGPARPALPVIKPSFMDRYAQVAVALLAATGIVALLLSAMP